MSRNGVTVKITDKVATRSLAKLFGSKRARVKVGVFGDNGAAQANGAKGLSVADLAAAHEFGLGVPERSFIRSYFDGNEDKIIAAIIKLCERLLAKTLKSGKPASQAELKAMLDKLGLFMVGQIQARISGGEITPALDPRTIARKGSSTPLIDTGQLRSSIAHTSELDK